MTSTTDLRVDAYIDALPVWQQAICRPVRELVDAAGLRGRGDAGHQILRQQQHACGASAVVVLFP